MNSPEAGPQPVPAEPPPERPPRTLLRVPILDLAILFAIASSYVALLTYLGILRFDDFFTTNWDLGINQQMLWTAGHGRLLYETGDAEFFNVRSFLEVHSTFIAFLVVPLYALAPVPSTLFVLQGSVFVGSAFPLYLIARRAVRSRLLAFVVIGLYLLNFGVLAGLLYDFHWEAFVPLEFLTFFYLILTRRFWWSLLPLVAGICTLEVFPFLAGGVAVFVLYEEWEKAGFRWRPLFRSRDGRLAISLLAGMGVVYILLRLIQYVAIPYLVGSSGVASAVGQGIGSPFSFGASAFTLQHSADYWLLFIVSLAFLPVLAPKHLILTIPWFVFSVFLTPSFSSYFGNQYSLLAVATLSVAAVYGAGRIERYSPGSWLTGVGVGILLLAGAAGVVAADTASTHLLSVRLSVGLVALLIVPAIALGALLYLDERRVPAPYPGPFRRLMNRRVGRRAQRSVVVVALACFVGVNLLLSPLNVTNFQATPFPGYWFQYDQNPASSEMPWLTSFIPTDSVVLASDYLFPFVANNPNAWALPWYSFGPGEPPLYFPFSGSNLPPYVLIDTSDWGNLPASIGDQLFNVTTYGLVAYVYSTTFPGTLYLFELGFHGPTQARYLEKPSMDQYYSPASLATGSSGVYAANPFSRFGTVIDSTPATNPSYAQTCVWFGPYETILPGTYTLTASLQASLFPGGRAEIPILTMDAGPEYLPQLFNVTLFSSDFLPYGWTELTWQLTVHEPYPLMEFRGYLTYINGSPNGYLTLNYLELSAPS